jgi:hypothetical protein
VFLTLELEDANGGIVGITETFWNDQETRLPKQEKDDIFYLAVDNLKEWDRNYLRVSENLFRASVRPCVHSLITTA